MYSPRGRNSVVKFLWAVKCPVWSYSERRFVCLFWWILGTLMQHRSYSGDISESENNAEIKSALVWNTRWCDCQLLVPFTRSFVWNVLFHQLTLTRIAGYQLSTCVTCHRLASLICLLNIKCHDHEWNFQKIDLHHLQPKQMGTLYRKLPLKDHQETETTSLRPHIQRPVFLCLYCNVKIRPTFY